MSGLTVRTMVQNISLSSKSFMRLCSTSSNQIEAQNKFEENAERHFNLSLKSEVNYENLSTFPLNLKKTTMLNVNERVVKYWFSYLAKETPLAVTECIIIDLITSTHAIVFTFITTCDTIPFCAADMLKQHCIS